MTSQTTDFLILHITKFGKRKRHKVNNVENSMTRTRRSLVNEKKISVSINKFFME